MDWLSFMYGGLIIGGFVASGISAYFLTWHKKYQRFLKDLENRQIQGIGPIRDEQ